MDRSMRLASYKLIYVHVHANTYIHVHDDWNKLQQQIHISGLLGDYTHLHTHFSSILHQPPRSAIALDPLPDTVYWTSMGTE